MIRNGEEGQPKRNSRLRRTATATGLALGGMATAAVVAGAVEGSSSDDDRNIVTPDASGHVSTPAVQQTVEQGPGVDIIFAAKVREAVNAKRREANLPELKFNSDLTAFAEEGAKILQAAKPADTVDDVEFERLNALLKKRGPSKYPGSVRESWNADRYLKSMTSEPEVVELVIDAIGQKSLLDGKLKDIGIGCIQEPEVRTPRLICFTAVGQPAQVY